MDSQTGERIPNLIWADAAKGTYCVVVTIPPETATAKPRLETRHLTGRIAVVRQRA